MSPNLTRHLALTAATLTLLPLGLRANAQEKPVSPCEALYNQPTETKTIYLANTTQQNDSNEIMVAIRNSLCPGTKVYFASAQNALVLTAPPIQITLAEKIVSDLDRPRKTYRLTFTITELDAGKTIGTQHVSMVAVSGQHITMKEGDKIPIATGSYSNGEAASTPSTGVQTQFTYLDVGMNFDATVQDLPNGVSLRSKIEQSSVGHPSMIAGIQEPVVRQTVLEGTSLLTFGKPVMLGAIDVPDSTHHIDIAVVVDPIK
jgi:type II secretory pathway component GspD/PulD (secretin)